MSQGRKRANTWSHYCTVADCDEFAVCWFHITVNRMEGVGSPEAFTALAEGWLCEAHGRAWNNDADGALGTTYPRSLAEQWRGA